MARADYCTQLIAGLRKRPRERAAPKNSTRSESRRAFDSICPFFEGSHLVLLSWDSSRWVKMDLIARTGSAQGSGCLA
ncbi:hypothetical protein AOLI_G00103490 [Acnodon oligacanthus]